MIDLRYIREHPEEVKTAIEKLFSTAPIDEILKLDSERRALLTEVEQLKQERNVVSKEIGTSKDQAARQAKIEAMRKVGDRIAALDQQVREVDARLNAALLEVPNLPHKSVHIGSDESENIVVRQEGDLPAYDFTPRPHWELGPALGIMDFERGVKLSGTRFYVLKGAGARLERALIAWMLDLHVQQQGYKEIYPPFVVRRQCLVGAGQLPKFEDNLYRDHEDDLWMVPTAEVPLTNLHRDEILDAETLPIHYVAYTPCFRREKMSAGRDTRGIKRGHQFDKVEMYKFCTPETSYDELESLVDNAEDVCRALGISHRVVQMCSGDLGFAATKKYDVEMWAAGCQEWLEVSSCSNCETFQARRANIRYRPEPRSKPAYVHTLNGSGLGLPRTLIAVMENYQQADGSIVVPNVLRPYMGGLEVITKES